MVSLRSALFCSAFGLLVAACGAAETDQGSPTGSDERDAIGDVGGIEAAVDELTEDDGHGLGSLGDLGDVDSPLIAADDLNTTVDLPAATRLASESEVRATGNVNLRKGPGATHEVLALVPKGAVVAVLEPSPSNGYLKISFNGIGGWSSAAYLTALESTTASGPAGLDGAPSPENAIARAKTAVGFSYYWGGGVWLASGATSSNAGSCSGSCPSCTHRGRYGADCSGLVAKAWQFGAKALDVNSHPYSTLDFVKSKPGQWSLISRSSLKPGDALVYNQSGAGHIVIFDKGDAWGAATVYECRGCAYGCTHGTRTFASNYKAIRRAGF